MLTWIPPGSDPLYHLPNPHPTASTLPSAMPRHRSPRLAPTCSRESHALILERLHSEGGKHMEGNRFRGSDRLGSKVRSLRLQTDECESLGPGMCPPILGGGLEMAFPHFLNFSFGRFSGIARGTLFSQPWEGWVGIGRACFTGLALDPRALGSDGRGTQTGRTKKTPPPGIEPGSSA